MFDYVTGEETAGRDACRGLCGGPASLRVWGSRVLGAQGGCAPAALVELHVETHARILRTDHAGTIPFF